MDTPLVLVVTLNPTEVDDEAFNLDCVTHYPLSLYEAADRFEMPFTIKNEIQRAEDRLNKPNQFQGFLYSHHTSDISEGPLKSRYKDGDLTIRDKLQQQLYLARIIKAVNLKETAMRVLERHALPDLIGNLRAFASQKVRCVTCGAKYRRIPLRGECIKADCTKSNLIQTVFPKSVSKYFDVCESLILDYGLGKYHEDRLSKIKLALESHFTEKDPEEQQHDLSEWF